MKKTDKKTEDIILYPDLELKEFLIEGLDDLKLFLSKNKLNPMEQVMAVKLLLAGESFYAQKKIILPEGWIISGRKYFLADFYLPEYNLIIETDGKIHDNAEKYDYDRNRNNALVALGYRVFRFDWDDVMQKNPNSNVWVFIETLLNKLLIEEGERLEENRKNYLEGEKYGIGQRRNNKKIEAKTKQSADLST